MPLSSKHARNMLKHASNTYLSDNACYYPHNKGHFCNWLWHTPPIFTYLNAHCPPCSVFLKPLGGDGTGARALSSLLAALIIILLLLKESLFRGPKHAQKLMKLCTRFRSGENLRVIWFSKLGGANSVNYCPQILPRLYVSRTGMKFGTYM